ncbi:hypothetical protein [Gillisia limnaea]|uniref:Uncharacterized protein n=1 Tax=Gillisia limnaea (strain DSM 15749 / LMG 21470 / R-8282) TaxID=865937 RepID=H2BXF0_GILLR|nr:hypothetical protein [Gillisia limnaea]EHQ02032.1 hypothetical protein Gilli_1371 [Gillisia limnaea DSM 15749]
MNEDFSTLKGNWDSLKDKIDLPSASAIEGIEKKIKTKERENYFFYFGTIIILSLTLIGLLLFFNYVAPVQEIVSKIGAGLMIIGLLFRIIIEAISITKAKRIIKLDNTLNNLENLIKFHQFRKIIHNTISPIILTAYTIGFFIITPEFSKYIEFWYLTLYCISYFVAGIIIFSVIRKSVKNEMKKIDEILSLKKELTAQ